MANKWRKVKFSLGLKLNTCLYLPRTVEDEPAPVPDAAATRRSTSDAVSRSPNDHVRFRLPATPTSSSSGLVRSKSGLSSSKRTCAICLNTIRPGEGHAIFTAECSHSFHFHCVASSVKHGNRICPVCRAKWKEIPLKSLDSTGAPNGKSRTNPAGHGYARDAGWMTVYRGPPQLGVDFSGPMPPYARDPSRFDDDEPLDYRTQDSVESSRAIRHSHEGSARALEIVTHPEVPSVARFASNDGFSVLIHLKAPPTSQREDCSKVKVDSPTRAPVDLVTILDVSGSMAGTKLALLKRAMGFVIENLGPSDRLSVIAFSSTARRLFPLKRMSDIGRQQALQAVNSLVSNGGTNIVEGLRKGAKIMTDRKLRNPVSSIILLSDGQDTYNVSSPPSASRQRKAYNFLLPSSILRKDGTRLQIPVHTFGFGVDHDAAAMHAISETSGGMFSFIEAEEVIQDAFAQCIGGLLSVVVQDLQVELDCVSSKTQLVAIKSGSYTSTLSGNGREGSIHVGDLYAEEERDFLVTVKVPVDRSSQMTSLLKVKCAYQDPITKESVNLNDISEVKILRPETVGTQVTSREVERQLNRLLAAESMAEARNAAERGDLTAAVSVLEKCCGVLTSTASVQEGDRLCVSLCAELREMQERMVNRRVYEESGRAYVLSGLSSHSWQRATARSNSTNTDSLVHSYQTPSMVDMVTQSQTMIFGAPTNQRKLRSTLSFPGPQPR